MAWITIDDQFPDHPKLKSVGVFGLAIQIASICYCGRFLTDGFLSYSAAEAIVRSVLSKFTRTDGTVWTPGLTSGHSGLDAEEVDWKAIMVESELWDEVKNGYKVHDYLLYNPTKSQVVERRESAKERMRGVRTEVRMNKTGSYSEVNASSSSSLLSSFSLLWSLYPSPKGSKKDALREYKATIVPESAVEALRTQIAYKEACDKRGQFCATFPHMHRWIKKRRWEDEIPQMPVTQTERLWLEAQEEKQREAQGSDSGTEGGFPR